MTTDSAMETVQRPRGLGVVLVFLLICVGSAMAVVHSVHSNQKRINDLNDLLKANEQLQVEYGQLLLEQSTYGHYGLVETEARKKLEMRVPKSREIVIVKR